MICVAMIGQSVRDARCSGAKVKQVAALLDFGDALLVSMNALVRGISWSALRQPTIVTGAPATQHVWSLNRGIRSLRVSQLMVACHRDLQCDPALTLHRKREE